ncbi:hypothetical protein MNBD_ALPHA09-719 [hydrothermal vent metagenome]|uniref:DUF1579 domain-containing protein n=1 Tax=hydrothermal vent metagenome TaxID=652676 RepID=A0A3B0TDR9_9ZZZZ
MTRPWTSAMLTVSALMLAVAPAQAASEAAVLRMLKTPVANDATLASLMGKWRGRGKARAGSDKPPEATQCRFTNRWAAGGKLAHLLLACRGTEIRFTAEGYLGRSKASYLGAWSTSTGRRVTMSGARASSGLRLTLTATGDTTAPTSNFTLRVSGKRLTAKLTARDPRTGKIFTAFETTLKR